MPPETSVLDKDKVKRIGARMAELLEPLEAEFGVSVKVAGGQFDPAGTFTPRVVVALAGKSKESIAFERYATQWELEPRHLGARFKANGTEYRLVGLRPNAPRKPFLIERIADGKQFVIADSPTILAQIKAAS